jgi:hypothetical protein
MRDVFRPEWGGRFNKTKVWNKLNPDNQVLITNDFDKMNVESF